MTITVLAISGLSASSLGCYGELKSSTRTFDALASQSLVWNNVYSAPLDEDDLKSLFEGLGKIEFWNSRSPTTQSFFEVAEQLLSTELYNDFCAAASPEMSHQELFVALTRATDEAQARLVSSISRVAVLDELFADYVENLEFDTHDLLLVIGVSGDGMRLPAALTDWERMASEDTLHRPILAFSPLLESSGRVYDYLTLTELVEVLKESGIESFLDVDSWLEPHRTQRVDVELDGVGVVRTPEWLLVDRKPSTDAKAELEEESATEQSRTSYTDDERTVHLYRKPEDYWNMLDVASQYPGLVDDYLESCEKPELSWPTKRDVN